mgnify:CR=1 FL=1
METLLPPLALPVLATGTGVLLRPDIICAIESFWLTDNVIEYGGGGGGGGAVTAAADVVADAVDESVGGGGGGGGVGDLHDISELCVCESKLCVDSINLVLENDMAAIRF